MGQARGRGVAYCIMRTAKLGGKGKVAVSAAHLTRERECKNADPDKKHANQILEGAKNVKGVMAKLDERLATVGRKVRSNAVLAVELVITASPEWYKDSDGARQARYHRDAIDWVKQTFGKENILQVVCHRDETTPHLHILVTPIHEKINKKGQKVISLSAKDYLDGSKKLSELQSNFHEVVANKYDLDRGVQGSVAHHKRVQTFYKTLDLELGSPPVEIPKKGLFEPRKAFQRRASEYVTESNKGWTAGYKALAEVEASRRVLDEAKRLHEERQRVEREAAEVAAERATVEARRLESKRFWESGNANIIEAYKKEKSKVDLLQNEYSELKASNDKAKERIQNLEKMLLHGDVEAYRQAIRQQQERDRDRGYGR